MNFFQSRCPPHKKRYFFSFESSSFFYIFRIENDLETTLYTYLIRDLIWDYYLLVRFKLFWQLQSKLFFSKQVLNFRIQIYFIFLKHLATFFLPMNAFLLIITVWLSNMVEKYFYRLNHFYDDYKVRKWYLSIRLT